MSTSGLHLHTHTHVPVCTYATHKHMHTEKGRKKGRNERRKRQRKKDLRREIESQRKREVIKFFQLKLIHLHKHRKYNGKPHQYTLSLSTADLRAVRIPPGLDAVLN